MSVSKPGQRAAGPQIVIDPAGETIAVWTLIRKNHRSVIQSASRLPGGEWSAPRTISSFGSFEPQIAVNAAGEAIAVWRHFKDAHEIEIQSASRSTDGAWSATVTLSKGRRDVSKSRRVAFSPKIAIDPAGEAVAIWELSLPGDRYVVQSASRLPSGAWSAPINLSPKWQTPDLEGLQIAIGATGEAIAVWSRGGPTHDRIVQSASRSRGSTWSQPTKISAGEGEDDDPQIAFNAAGEVVALWEREEYNFRRGASTTEGASKPPRARRVASGLDPSASSDTALTLDLSPTRLPSTMRAKR